MSDPPGNEQIHQSQSDKKQQNQKQNAPSKDLEAKRKANQTMPEDLNIPRGPGATDQQQSQVDDNIF